MTFSEAGWFCYFGLVSVSWEWATRRLVGHPGQGQHEVESAFRMRSLSSPLGHRSVFQTGKAEPQARQFSRSPRQRGEMAGLHGLAGVCATAIQGSGIVMPSLWDGSDFFWWNCGGISTNKTAPAESPVLDCHANPSGTLSSPQAWKAPRGGSLWGSSR